MSSANSPQSKKKKKQNLQSWIVQLVPNQSQILTNLKGKCPFFTLIRRNASYVVKSLLWLQTLDADTDPGSQLQYI